MLRHLLAEKCVLGGSAGRSMASTFESWQAGPATEISDHASGQNNDRKAKSKKKIALKAKAANTCRMRF